MLDVLVIGAGQAGLATAYALQRAGLSYQILEGSGRAAGSWPSYYDSLRLFSPARFSGLPGLPFPGDPERYPARDEVVAYLEHYARHFDFHIVFGERVTEVRREGQHFWVQTETQGRYHARAIVVATGPFQQPHIPTFEGLNQFEGQVLHSSAYHRPSDIHGNRVAVIGAGNSAVQIAYELASNHEVLLTARQPPQFMQQRTFGKDIHFWLKYSGFDSLPLGHWWGYQATSPVLDPGQYRGAFDQGHIEYHPLFDRITARGLQWGETERPIDTLLLATGFIQRPAFLDGLDGFDAAHVAQQSGGVSRHSPGVYFVGGAWQRSHASATLRGVGTDAQYIVHHLQRYLRGKPEPQSFLQGCCG